jgi:hypothetical protein
MSIKIKRSKNEFKKILDINNFNWDRHNFFEEETSPIEGV